MKTLLIVAVLAWLAPLLAGCNTVQGLGKDISKAGDAIEDAAANAKKR